jgi:hypothetical protein
VTPPKERERSWTSRRSADAERAAVGDPLVRSFVALVGGLAPGKPGAFIHHPPSSLFTSRKEAH